tara:strand:+ start:2455 stop:4440 length:1986 start_codon:yes stop_codon:yes gene_type:complete
MKKILFTLFLAITGTNLIAQGLTLYNMDYVPQSMRNNPAQMQRANFHIAITPLLPNVSLSTISNGFTLSDIFETVGDTTYATPDKLLDALGENNFISQQLNVDFISFGFKVKKKNYFSFNVTERVNFALDYSKNFMTLLAKGTANDEFLGNEISIDGTGFRFNHFREYGLGYTREVNDKLSIGGRFKFLQGLSHFDNEQTDITLYTDPVNYSITATSSIGVRVAGLGSGLVSDKGLDFAIASILPAPEELIPSYTTNFENIGFAIDLGAKYKINDRFTSTLNVTDVGFITWKTDARRYFNNKAEFKFEGLDLTQYLADSTEYTDQLADSINDIFGLERRDQQFTTNLIANIYAGVEYKLNNTFTAGALFNGKVFNGGIYPSLTITTQTALGKWFQAIVSYSMLNRSYDNFGLGTAINVGPVQLYAVSDNVLGWTQIDYAKNLNVQFGMNLLFGYKPKVSKEDRKIAKLKRKLSKLDSDGDGTNDYEDKCPDVEGFVNGCPDKDGDGVGDNVDMCPDIIGDSELFGCPDKDNDGVADYQDSCPDVYGLLGGCPDVDGDSVPDSKDLCPNTPGKLGGCPDSDGDGVSDGKDACPEKPGDAANKGCPDTDGDGIFDNDDRCPEIKGDIQHLGCTDKDSDRDGTADVFDDCPYRSGPESNGGCPE